MAFVNNKIAVLRKQKGTIKFELTMLETIAAKQQRWNGNEIEQAIVLLKTELMDLRQVLDQLRTSVNF